MKIRMITSAIDNDCKSYEFGREFIVGKNIDREKAESFVKGNLAYISEEDVEVEYVEVEDEPTLIDESEVYQNEQEIEVATLEGQLIETALIEVPAKKRKNTKRVI